MKILITTTLITKHLKSQRAIFSDQGKSYTVFTYRTKE